MGSSQYLYNAKMREEIVEQLGVTPTPGGLQKLLEQNETDRLNSDSEDYSLGSLYDESIESMEEAGIGRILPIKYNPAAKGVAGISALISNIMMDGSMDKFNELGDPEDINFSPTGMANGGMADLLNQDDGFGDEESYQRALEKQAIIFAKSSPDNWDYEEALDNMAMNIAGGHRLEKIDVIEDLEQAIAERRVIEGTPDGLSFRDRFKEKFGMESGGIVSLANGGDLRMTSQERADARAIADAVANRARLTRRAQESYSYPDPVRQSTGSIMKEVASSVVTPDRIGDFVMGSMNPIFPLLRKGIDFISKKKKDKKDRMRDPFAPPEPTTPKGPYNLNAYNWSPSKGANLSGSDNTAFSAMFNVGGSSGMGKGAGGNFGQGQRMERRERRRMRNMPIEQRLELESRGFGSGAQAARERVSANPSAGLSLPSNYDEIRAYYMKYGGFDENAPVAQWGDA